MKNQQDTSFDPETVALLQRILDEGWAALPSEQQVRTSKSDLATRLLKAASTGERDPIRLLAAIKIRLPTAA